MIRRRNINEDRIRLIVRNVINEVAGNLCYTDEDGNICTNSEETWRGVPNTTVIWHGEWSDPEIAYNGVLLNYNEVEERLYEYFKDEVNDFFVDDDFEKWCSGLSVSYLEEILDDFYYNAVQ